MNPRLPMPRISAILSFCLASTLALAAEFPAMDFLKESETLSSAQLKAAEQEEILKQIQLTAGDDRSVQWEKNLRVRRVFLGAVNGLVIRGSGDFCSPTGNCTTWVFRKQGEHWVSLFLGDPPIAQGFAFERQASHGIRNLVLSEHGSAFESLYQIWSFNGKAYAPAKCYDVSYPLDGRGGPRTTVTPCN